MPSIEPAQELRVIGVEDEEFHVAAVTTLRSISAPLPRIWRTSTTLGALSEVWEPSLKA